MIILSSLLYKPHIGGIENSLFHMAKIFQNNGHRVAIYVSDKGSEEGIVAHLPNFEIIDGLEVHRFKRRVITFRMLNIFRSFFDIYDAYKHARKTFGNIEIDLMINRNAQVGIGLNLALKKKKSVYILPALTRELDKVHGKKHLIEAGRNWVINNLVLNLNHLLQMLLIKQSSFSVVFSNMMYNSIPSKYRRDCKIYVQPPGVSRRDKKGSQLASQESNECKKEYDFLIVGRIVGVKAIDIAIKAFSKIKNSKARLAIVGDGPELYNLKALSRRLSILDRIKFIGSTTQPEQYYLKARFFVMSSIYETFGQTILEAMSVGLPVVGFNSNPPHVRTATSEIVENEINGYLCDFSEESLTKTFNRCLGLSKREIQRISEANIKKTTEIYTWNALCDFVKKTE